MKRKVVSTPKQHFIDERDRFYSDWTLSWWRENFQNSVDAGAKNIDIKVAESARRGSFDQPAESQSKVVRIVFSDDGSGMTRDTLDNVFFQIGATTKGDGNSTGGYGRARLMTAFSNVRYSILTQGSFVMGDGPDYVSYGLDEARSELAAARRALRDENGGETHEVAAEHLQDDERMVLGAMAEGGHKGCRLEVDLDPTAGRYWDSKPTEERMLERLKDYLSESQIACKVTINGKSPEEFYGSKDKIASRRGQSRLKLQAIHEGALVDFATVHTSEGEKAAHKGRVIVRVDGASMFTRSASEGVQVIVELDPTLSRDAMTSNRDDLRGGFKDALDAFLRVLAIDNKSAMKDRESKQTQRLKGERGALKAKPPAKKVDLDTQPSMEEFTTAAKALVSNARFETSIDFRRFGVPEEVLGDFVKRFREGDSFVNAILFRPDFQHGEAFRDLRNRWPDYDRADPASALDGLPGDARAWLGEMLRKRFAEATATQVKVNEERLLEDLHDTYIRIETTNPKTRKAAYRNDPRNWDYESGKGRRPKALLTAWTAACTVAADTLLKVRPGLGEFAWSTGFIYSVPERKYEGDSDRLSWTKAAHLEEDDTHFLLLNPVLENGELAYNPANADDRQRLIALACHEVAHVVQGYHDETYAGILTDLVGEIDGREANRRMTTVMKAVYAAYESGKARVQAMDAEDGPRPAERLLAAANPGRDTSDAFERDVDGTMTVDCDKPRSVGGGYSNAFGAEGYGYAAAPDR